MTGPRPAGRPWTLIEDRQLRHMLKAGKKAPEIARTLKRTIGAIYARREYLDKKAEDAAHLRVTLVKIPI
jgi:hypothetical protein